jgi:hypothetical protein
LTLYFIEPPSKFYKKRTGRWTACKEQLSTPCFINREERRRCGKKVQTEEGNVFRWGAKGVQACRAGWARPRPGRGSGLAQWTGLIGLGSSEGFKMAMDFQISNEFRIW